jgi:phosphotransferase system HPr (HPr) family protein
MIEIDLTVAHPAGLHARPAAAFVQTAARFEAKLAVANPARDPARWVDATSILGLMTLGVGAGQTLRLRADGPDEADAVAALRDLIAGTA